MEEKIQSFLDLNVWRKAHHLVLNIYQMTPTLPAHEQFTLADQLKRTSSRCASTIAEGFQKRQNADKIKLYNDAQASIHELYYLLLLTRDLQYSDTTELMENTHEIQKMLGGLVRSVAGIVKNNHNHNHNHTATVRDDNHTLESENISFY